MNTLLHRQSWTRAAASLCLGLGLTLPAFAQNAPEPSGTDAPTGSASLSREELRAKRMIDSGLDLLQGGQAERGVSTLEAATKMFPDTKARFRAHLALGQYWASRKEYPKAVREFARVRESEDAEELAEALFRTGVCHFDQNNFNEAFVALRKVTNDHPTSMFANQAYYYIGQGHFQQRRWGKAAEAFRMVGTAVPDTLEQEEIVLAEAGQRLFVKVEDKDLRILGMLGQVTRVEVVAESGDREEAVLEPLGRTDKDYIASVETAPTASQVNDGVLTVQGGELITVRYLDQNNAAGEANRPLLSKARVVSTAAVSFTDGAYNQRVAGLFAGQPAFLRLKDLDLDQADTPDTVQVRVTARYKIKKSEDEEADVPQDRIDVDALAGENPEDAWELRGSTVVTLTESQGRSGLFHGSFTPVLTGRSSGQSTELEVEADDELTVEYLDELHLGGKIPQTRTATARIVVGGSTDPQSIVASTDNPNVQARKLLIEARLLHKWGSIFKEVGLDDTAAAKAEEGLERADQIMHLTARHSLERSTVEETFAVKWDLYMIQDRLNEAIATCNALVSLFPDTDLADRAFMKIAQARLESEDPGEITEAIRVFRSVIALADSDYKAEAQYRIGEATEKLIRINLKTGTQPNMAPAMLEYRKCAESYPDSSFAGESFKKITNFYIQYKDYVRAVEVLERVFQDYPDAPWLDEMLLKWGVVAFRMDNRPLAIEKFQRLLEEYPDSDAARQAAQFLQRLQG